MKKIVSVLFSVLFLIQISSASQVDEKHLWHFFSAKALKNGFSVGEYTYERLSEREDVRFFVERPSALATSTLDSNSERYSTKNMRDANMETAWCEGNAGPGVGQKISFDETDINGYMVDALRFRIMPGYARTNKLFTENARPKNVILKVYTVELADDPLLLEEFLVEDKNYRQEFKINLPQQFSTQDLKFELIIDSVYEGEKFDDMCISDLRILPDGKNYNSLILEQKDELRAFEWRQADKYLTQFSDDPSSEIIYGQVYPLILGFRYNEGIFSPTAKDLNKMLVTAYMNDAVRFLNSLVYQDDLVARQIVNIVLVGNVTKQYSYKELYEITKDAKRNGVRYKHIDLLIHQLSEMIRVYNYYVSYKPQKSEYPIQYKLNNNYDLSAEVGDSNIVYFLKIKGNMTIKADFVVEYEKHNNRHVLKLYPHDGFKKYFTVWDRGRETRVDEIYLGDEIEIITKLVGTDIVNKLKNGQIKIAKGTANMVVSGVSSSHECDKLSFYGDIEKIIKVDSLVTLKESKINGGC